MFLHGKSLGPVRTSRVVGGRYIHISTCPVVWNTIGASTHFQETRGGRYQICNRKSEECGSIDNHEGWSAVHVRRPSGRFEKDLIDAWVVVGRAPCMKICIWLEVGALSILW